MNILTSIKTKSKKAVKVISNSALALCASGTAVVLGSIPAHAEGDITDMFAAADFSGLSTNIKAMLITFLAIMVLFVCYKYIKRGANRA